MRTVHSFLTAALLTSTMTVAQLDNNGSPSEINFEKRTLDDGKTYIGQTKYGVPNGIGTLIDKAGNYRTGTFQAGEYTSAFIASPPWHLVDIDIFFDSLRLPLETYTIDVEVLTDVPDNMYLYISPFAGTSINGVDFYGGMQTRCGGYKDPEHESNKSPFKEQGRSMIFSRWDERSGEAIQMAEGGVCESSGYEGDFISVRNKLNWNKGKYTFLLFRTNRLTIINKQIHTFVNLSVYDHQTKKTINCGSLAFPGTDLIFSNRQMIFAELYGKEVNASDIPYCKVEFSNIRYNADPVDIQLSAALYDLNYPVLSNAQYENGRFTIEIGRPFYHPLTEHEGTHYELIYVKDDE
jgi:hypothetical protein